MLLKNAILQKYMDLKDTRRNIYVPLAMFTSLFMIFFLNFL